MPRLGRSRPASNYKAVRPSPALTGTGTLFASAALTVTPSFSASASGGVVALTDSPVTSSTGAATAGVFNTANSFSPAAGAMVLVRVENMFTSATTGAATLTCADSHGNTYTSAVQGQNTYFVAGAAIFWHVYSSAPGSTTLTITSSNTTVALELLVSPTLITGQASSPIGPNVISVAPSGSTTALTSSLTTTVAGSRVYLAGGVGTGSAMTAASNTTTTATYNGYNNAATGIATAATGTPGATSFGWTCSPASAFGGNLLGVEVLPAAGGGTPHTSSPSLTVTPSFSAPGTAALSATAALAVSPSFVATGQETSNYGTPILDSAGGGILDSAGVQILDTAGSASAALTVTPVIAASGAVTGGAETATAALTVAPSFTAPASSGVSASLPVTPVLSASAGDRVSASLTVPPAFTASGTPATAAALTVTPVLSAEPEHGAAARTDSAALIVSPEFNAQATTGVTAALAVAPSFTAPAVVSAAGTASAALTVNPEFTTDTARTGVPRTGTAGLVVTPSLGASTQEPALTALVVTPSFTVSEGTGTSAALTVSPEFTVDRSRNPGPASAALTVTPSFTSSHAGGAPPAFSSSPSSVPGEMVPGSGVPGNPGASVPPPGWPPYYTTNFNPNPSLEYGTTGYSPLVGTELVAQVGTAFSGQYGLQVVTPGLVPGEGVATPYGRVLAGAQGSMSLYIYGDTGTLTVSAIQNPGGHVLGSVQVQPDPGDWQRVELDQLPMAAGDDVFLMVYTTTAQALTYVIDAVQYEPESPAHPYVDGDQANGTWTAQPGAGDTMRIGAALDRATAPAATASYQQFQNSTSAAGGMTLEGAIEITVHGTVFQVGKVAGQMDMSGQQFDMCAVTETGRTVIAPAIDTGVLGLPWVISGGGAITSVALVTPGSGFAQFAVFASTDPDPAMTLLGPNNAGTDNASGTAGSYTQVYGTFTPPQQQLDSNGNAVWQAAAYMAAGFRIASQGKWSSGSPNGVNFTQVQVEKATGSTPSAYQRPRALSTIVKPTAMNYVTNPSVEVSTTGWTAAGGATLTQVPGGYQGGYSLQVSVPSAGGSVSIEVPELIFGDVFNASAYVNPVSGNIVDVTLAAGGESVSANPTGYPFGAAGFGSGPYGGVNADSAPMAAGWNYRPWTAFTAPASTVTLTLTPVAVSGAAYPLVFNVDCVMVTPGEVITSYADGSSDGWQWELGGTPGLSRSYYYERESVAANAVQSVLGMHIPLGLSAYAPQFALPATQ